MLIFDSDQCEPCVDYGIRLCSKEFHYDADDSPKLFYDTVMIIIDSLKSLDCAVDKNDVRMRHKVKRNTITKYFHGEDNPDGTDTLPKM